PPPDPISGHGQRIDGNVARLLAACGLKTSSNCASCCISWRRFPIMGSMRLCGAKAEVDAAPAKVGNRLDQMGERPIAETTETKLITFSCSKLAKVRMVLNFCRSSGNFLVCEIRAS